MSTGTEPLSTGAESFSTGAESSSSGAASAGLDLRKAATGNREPVLSIRNLTTEFAGLEETVLAVDDVSYDVMPGETLGVVGESGSGKSVTVLSAMGLLESPPARVTSGSVLFDGVDLLSLPDRELRRLRGSRIGMIFQDPSSSLNPVFRVGTQIIETLRIHEPSLTKTEGRRRATDLLATVGIPDPEARLRQYPHQFSGGMQQRVMIALAMSNQPRLIIADEPTTALDVTIQAQVLRVLDTARTETGASVVLITHDLGVVAERADRVVVMYAGQIVETAGVYELFGAPSHPYSIGLLASRPDIRRASSRLSAIPGSPPQIVDRAPGCRFRERCLLSHGRERCATETPVLRLLAQGHRAACHFAEESAELRATSAAFTPTHPGPAVPLAITPEAG